MRGWREEMVALSLQGHGHGADGDDDRPEKPRRYGVTEMRSPDYSFRPAHHALQEILESIGPFVDGLKFSGGSHSLMGKELIREITDLAHKHEMYVSTGDWAEHLLRQGPSSFKQYVEECKELGFDTIELNAGSLKLPEEAILRLVRLIKSSERVEDVDLLIRRAERCLEAGADMIMIDADDVCQHTDSLRADIVAKIVGRLGLEKTMFETSNANTSEWFVKRYGPRVNLFADHTEVMNLERLRGFDTRRGSRPLLTSPFFLVRRPF
ncbi:hypothetical protein ACQ4PT_041663 [Festuca glaucescens]